MTGLDDLEETVLCSFADDVVCSADEFEERGEEHAREVAGEGRVKAGGEGGEKFEGEFGEAGTFGEHLQTRKKGREGSERGRRGKRRTEELEGRARAIRTQATILSPTPPKLTGPMDTMKLSSL